MKYYIVIISLLIAFLTTGALTVQTIYQAIAVSKPVQITINLPATNTENEIRVTRLSRGGAQFGIPAIGINTWETKEWVRAIEITYPATLDTLALEGSLKIGQDIYPIDFKKTNPQNKAAIAEPTVLITRESLNRPAALMPFFGSILNWPGDFAAVFRAVHTHLLWFVACFFFCYLLLSLYLRYLNLPNSEPSEIEHKHNLQVITPILALLLGIISALLFINNGPTAYEWPTLDMGPFFERHADSTFLTNDFFTNTSNEPNPRFIFGYLVIGIQTLLQTDWYGSLFLIKILLIVLLPPLLFLSLQSFFYKFDTRKKITASFGLFIFILAALSPFWIDQFTIALWRPLVTMATPHAFAFAVGLVAIYLANNSCFLTSLPFWFLSSLINPTVGLCFFIFFAIISFRNIPYRNLLKIFIFGIIVPFAILVIGFGAENPLPSKEFVYHYIISNHSIHYLLSAFESSPLSPFPWYFHFIIINLLFTAALFFGWKKSDRFIFNTAALVLITYIGSVLICYLFIELWPIKIVALIGPSRYTMFGYWFCVILGAAILMSVPHRYLFINTLLRPFQSLKPTPVWLSSIVALGLIIIGTYNHYIDNPKKDWLDSHKELSTWINTTDKEAVFATNDFSQVVNIPLVTKRGVFSGNGFPFREDFFIEFDNRRSLLFGSPEDWATMTGGSDRIKSSNYFHHLSPKDFLSISHQYRLDYVIIEPAFNQAFQAYNPVYADTTMLIYKVDNFSSQP